MIVGRLAISQWCMVLSNKQVLLWTGTGDWYKRRHYQNQ